jgi:integrase
MGNLYQRGAVWWLSYYWKGKQIRESSGTTKKTVADRLLKTREGEIAEGKLPRVFFDEVTFDELAEDFLSDYRVNGRKSLASAQVYVRHLRKRFEGARASTIDTPTVKKYVEARLAEGAASATVNRELAALKRMFNLGAESTPPKIDRVPHVAMLKENNARKGFFEHHEFLALRDALPEYLKGFVTFGYRTGWRLSEIRNLEWKRVDRQEGIIRLDAGETKNDAARTLYLDSELRAVIERQWELRKRSGRVLPYVFPNEDGTDKIKEFKKTWKRACKETKIGGKLFHDFRRTAIRNIVRAGVPERVAMMISGHKTRSVFDRYNIVSDADLRLAAMKHEAYLNEKANTTSTIPSTISFPPTGKATRASS